MYYYYDAEGEHNPMFGPGSLSGAFPADEHGCTRDNWSGLIGEAQAAFRITLDEIALLASIVTAETATQSKHHTPASPIRSAYSLLLEPAFFKFPS